MAAACELQIAAYKVNRDIDDSCYGYAFCQGVFGSVQAFLVYAIRSMTEEARYASMFSLDRGCYCSPYRLLRTSIRMGDNATCFTNFTYGFGHKHPMPGRKITFKKLRKIYWDKALQAEWMNLGALMNHINKTQGPCRCRKPKRRFKRSTPRPKSVLSSVNIVA